MALVESVPIEGLSVYGVAQKSYTVDGVENLDYVRAASIAMLREAVAFESEAAAFTAVLEARKKKLDELGWALSVIVEAIASMKVKKQKSGDLSAADADLGRAAGILDRYRRDTNGDMRLPVNGDGKVRRDDATKAQSALQYEIDWETNEMQQDMVTMQSLVSKRDNAFSTAASLVQKMNSTASTLIGNMI